jgi:hypothetical protein
METTWTAIDTITVNGFLAFFRRCDSNNESSSMFDLPVGAVYDRAFLVD